MTGTTMSVRKSLSANDLGRTGSHQAGILIPKDDALLSFFPRLDEEAPNPRRAFIIYAEDGDPIRVNLIHYNGRVLGTGTRDEYRITGIGGWLRRSGLEPGDWVEIECAGGVYRMRGIASSTSRGGASGTSRGDGAAAARDGGDADADGEAERDERGRRLVRAGRSWRAGRI